MSQKGTALDNTAGTFPSIQQAIFLHWMEIYEIPHYLIGTTTENNPKTLSFFPGGKSAESHNRQR